MLSYIPIGLIIVALGMTLYHAAKPPSLQLWVPVLVGFLGILFALLLSLK